MVLDLEIFIKLIIGLMVSIFGYLRSKQYVKAFKGNASNLIDEFYFLEDMLNNFHQIPLQLRDNAYIIICKIYRPKLGVVSEELKNTVGFIFNKDKNLKAIKYYLNTDKIILKDGVFQYKKNYWFKERTFNFLGFAFATLLSISNIFIIYLECKFSLTLFQVVFLLVFNALFFLAFTYLSLRRYGKFYWAKKFLDEIN